MEFSDDAERRWEGDELVVTIESPPEFSTAGVVASRTETTNRYSAQEIDQLLYREFSIRRTLGLVALGIGAFFIWGAYAVGNAF